MKTLQHFCDCSGGEAQRVWIATVLAQQPDLLFLDEPTAFLDISYQVEVMQLVKKLNREMVWASSWFSMTWARLWKSATGWW